VALVVDAVVGTRELEDGERVPADQVLPGAEYIHSVAKLDGNLVLICDLDQFLSFDDEEMVDEALPRETA
jgi:chemotaxis signal transduction protein